MTEPFDQWEAELADHRTAERTRRDELAEQWRADAHGGMVVAALALLLTILFVLGIGWVVLAP